jgi:outer membrane protein assembly factor BamE (lipoprotein component of BamABCDE complex)
MRRVALLFLLAASLLGLAACRPGAKSGRSFDQIQQLVAGKTAAEVAAILGPPSTRQALLADDERWIWWNYTYLDGANYAPEIRGQVVHLEITFESPSLVSTVQVAPVPREQWRVSGPLAVSYSLPARRGS